MELLTVLLIFDSLQRTIKPRPDAFDKCRVLEIKNSALILAFAFQDIKDIKRRRTLSAQRSEAVHGSGWGTRLARSISGRAMRKIRA